MLSGLGGDKALGKHEFGESGVLGMRSIGAMDQVQGSLIGKSPAWHVARVSKCVYRSRHTNGSCAHQCLRELSLPPAPCLPRGTEALEALRGGLAPFGTTSTDQRSSGLDCSCSCFLPSMPSMMSLQGRCPIKPRGCGASLLRSLRPQTASESRKAPQH